MAKKTRNAVKIEEESKEITCKALGLEYRSKMKRIIEILETPGSHAELDLHCGSTATKFKDLLAGIGTHIPAAGIVAVAMEFVKGGLK